MFYIMHKNELVHHGVKGMKWGIRKERASSDKKQKRQLTPEEKRARIHKAVAITAAVGITAVLAYNAHNAYIQKYVGKTLKTGHSLHTIANNQNLPAERFYAAYKKADRMKYRGMYGGAQLGGVGGANIYDIKSKLVKDVKVASEKQASETFLSLYKNNPEFRKTFDSHISNMQKHAFIPGKAGNIINNVTANMSDKDIKNHGYKAFNLLLVDRNNPDYSSKVVDTFYSSMKKKGFSGIFDMNDVKWSGYKSNSPVIVFDKPAVVKNTVTRLGQKELKKDLIKSIVYINGQSLAVPILAAVGYKNAEAAADYREIAKEQHDGQKKKNK